VVTLLFYALARCELGKKLVLVIVDVEHSGQASHVEDALDHPVGRDPRQVKLAVDAPFSLVRCDKQVETGRGKERHAAQGEDNVGWAGRGLLHEVGVQPHGGGHVEFSGDVDDDHVVAELAAGQTQVRLPQTCARPA